MARMNGNTSMRRIVSVMLCICLFTKSFDAVAQEDGNYGYKPKYSYSVENVEYLSTSDVQVSMIVYNSKKKEVENDAKCSAIRMFLYDGVGHGVFSRALLPDGEQTSFQNNWNYLHNLYENRLTDFISECTMKSAFRKADKQKGTRFVIIVHANKLRRDLEKNNMKRQMGL